MGVLKTLLGVVILVAIGVVGYWLFKTYTLAAADDEFWVKINSNMPTAARHWACEQVNARVQSAQAPEGCGDVWKASVAPQGDAGPAIPAPSVSADAGEVPMEPLTPPSESTGATANN